MTVCTRCNGSGEEPVKKPKPLWRPRYWNSPIPPETICTSRGCGHPWKDHYTQDGRPCAQCPRTHDRDWHRFRSEDFVASGWPRCRAMVKEAAMRWDYENNRRIPRRCPHRARVGDYCKIHAARQGAGGVVTIPVDSPDHRRHDGTA